MSKQGFLKGLIFKDGTPEQASTEKSKSGGKVSKNPVQSVSTTTVQGVADNKFIDLLEGIIEQSNLPGQDYFEFKQALENMNSLPMDERTKFQTVYQVLSLQGCTKAVLLTSLDKYIQIIQNEKTNFDTEMQSAYDANVKSKLLKAEESKKELETLSKRVSELNGSILVLSQEAQAEEMKIRATEANFKASADIIISEMIGDKDKINNFITK
jgi:hypothetical protein